MSFPFGYASLGGFKTGIIAPTPPGPYLPASPAGYLVFASKRVVNGYNGPLYQVRNSGGTTLDVYPASGSDIPSITALNSFGGGSILTIVNEYDQRGTGFFKTNPTVANQPVLDTVFLTGGAPSICYDSNTRALTGYPSVIKWMSVDGLTINRRNTSYFSLMTIQSTANQDGISGGGTSFCSFSDSARTASDLNWFVTQSSLTTGTLQTIVRHASTNMVANATPRTSPGVIGFVTTSTGVTQYLNNTSASQASAIASVNMPRLTVGDISPTNTPFAGRYVRSCDVIFNSSLNNTDSLAIIAAINACYGLSNSLANLLICMDGDSREQGGGSIQCRNTQRQIPFITAPDLYNPSIFGQSMASAYANRANRYAYLSGRPASYPVGNSFFFEENGINDLGSGTTAAALYAISTNMKNYITPFGYTYVPVTLLPRTDAPFTAPMEAERIAYNNLIRANAMGAAFYIDPASEPTVGPPLAPNNTALYWDKIHNTGTFTNPGYGYIAPVYYNALCTYLGYAA